MLRLAVVALALCATAGASDADDDPSITEADRLFDEGRALAGRGDHAGACERFTASLQLDYSVGTQLNLADCTLKLGRTREAWRLFTAAAAAADRTGDTKRAAFARQRASATAATLGTVVVRIADSARTDLSLTIAGRALPPAAVTRDLVEPGTVTVVVSVPGHSSFERTITAGAGETATIDVPAFRDASTPSSTGRQRGSRARAYATWGLLAGGGASALAASLFAWRGKSAYDDAANGPACTQVPGGISCSDDGTRAIDDAQRTADIGTAFAIASIVMLGAGAYLYITAPGDVAITPVAGADSVGVAAAGRF